MDTEAIKVLLFSAWFLTGFFETLKVIGDEINKKNLNYNESLFLFVIIFIFGFLLFPIRFILGAISVIRRQVNNDR